MKRIPTLLLAIFLLFLAVSGARAQSPPNPLTVKGLHLGMDRGAVKEVYDRFVRDQVAQRISMESEDYRDLITVDNELSSMGNKVELAYDESGLVTGITFQHRAVDILFDAAGEAPEAFVARFCQDFGLPAMEKKDQGVIVLWTLTDEAAGFKVSVDNNKNLRIQRL